MKPTFVKFFAAILLPVLFPALLICPSAFAQVQVDTYQHSQFEEIDPQKFIQIRQEQGEPSALQMANVRYVPQNGIPPDMYVDLISVVHVADKDYYQKLNELFEDYDVVLYELVAEEGTRVNPNDKSGKKSLLHGLQTTMKNVLGLSFQLDEIDYNKPNFVHADISPEEFSKSMDARGESFFSMFLRLWLVSLQQQTTNPNAFNNMDLMMALFAEDSEKRLKNLAARQFLDMDPVMKAIEGENGSTIVTERNLKALKVLRQEIEKGHKSFAIFYGAAHMPEMAKVLKKQFKMKKQSVTWLDAWDLK